VLDLRTRKVNRSALSSKAIAISPARNPELKLQGNAFGIPNSNLPLPSEFQSKKPLSLRITRCCTWYGGMDILWNHPLDSASLNDSHALSPLHQGRQRGGCLGSRLCQSKVEYCGLSA